MDTTPSIQDLQKLQGEMAAIAAVVTLVLASAGRWIGGAWTTLFAALGCLLYAYHPLTGAKLFSDLMTHRLQMTAIALVPLAVILIGFAFELIPLVFLIGFVVVGIHLFSDPMTDRLQMSVIALIPFSLILIGLSFEIIPIGFLIAFALIGPALVLGWVYHDYAVASTPRMTLFVHRILPICGAIFAVWLVLEPMAVRTPGPGVPMVVAAIAIASTFLLMLSAVPTAGLMSTPVSGMAIGGAAAAIISTFIRNRQLSFARGPVLLWLTILGMMFAFLWISNDKLPLPYLYWLAAVPVLAWIPELPPIHRLKPWNREALRILLVGYPAMMSMMLAFKDHQVEAKASGDEFGLIYPAYPVYPAAPTSPYTAAPYLPKAIPIASTINPPTIT